MLTDDEPALKTFDGLAAEVAELRRLALRDRWGRALVAVGWFHLAVFLVCQVLFWDGDRSPAHFLPLWGLDLASAVLIMRRALGSRASRPALGLLGVAVRVWVTYFILCFTAVSLNKLTGMQSEWFKISWASLATFGFATMAWIFHLGFLIPAVQMSLTGLLIARFPSEAYWIFGVSWCLALNGLGWTLERRRGPSRADDEDTNQRPATLGRVAEAR